MTTNPDPDPADPWNRALLALALLAIDPTLGGLHIRARAGPVRADFLTQIRATLGVPVQIHPTVSDEQLFGGLDLTATLTAGRLITQSGLLTRPGPRMLVMAERCTPHLAARLALSLDDFNRNPLLLLDEGADDEEVAPRCLSERVAFRVDLDLVAHSATGTPGMEADALTQARARLADIACPDDVSDDVAGVVTALCLRLGVDSLRAPLFALKAARAHAALSGRSALTPEDLEVAVSLVLTHRATQLPSQDPPPAEDEQVEPDGPESDENDENDDQAEMLPPEDMVLDAVLAQLPADFLASAASRNQKGAKGTGSGAKRRGNRRGRPLPPRPGRLDGRARLDLVATLRAAAPWQKIRRSGGDSRLRIHASDIHVKRFDVLSDRLLIFAVDASGSSAIARLAEAKGAIELLLGQAYARRDHVAMVAFRGGGAETLLSPTRSLVQAKRRLAGLPGGGGTPLASGLRQAGELAQLARQRGLTPTVVLLTDGRANITLEGTPGRPQAALDAQAVARDLAGLGIEALIIDTGSRPEPALRQLADILAAPYLALPRADSVRLSQAVTASIAD